MNRGRILTDLATGCSGLKRKELNSNNQKKIFQDKSKNYDSSSRPDYVEMFDLGKWEEFQHCLKLNLNIPKNKTNDICSRIFNQNEGTSSNETKDSKNFTYEIIQSDCDLLSLSQLNEENLNEEHGSIIGHNSFVTPPRTVDIGSRPLVFTVSPDGDLILQENDDTLSSRKELFPCVNVYTAEVCNKENQERQPFTDLTNGETIMETREIEENLEPDQEKKHWSLSTNLETETEMQETEAERIVSSQSDLEGQQSIEELDIPMRKRQKRCDRRNCCFYCSLVLTNLTRHMVRQHPDEIEVARYIALFELSPTETKEERQKIMETLRLKGNHIHNSSIINQPNSGYQQILPIKRPPIKKEKGLSSYVSCKICHGLFVRKTFFRHAQFCQGKSTDSSLGDNQAMELRDLRTKSLPSFIKVYGISTCPKPNNVCVTMTDKIIPRLWKDEVGQLAVNDKLILNTCNDFLKSHLDPKDHNQVARKMRDGSKLLAAIQNKDSTIQHLCDCFNPSKLNIVVEAIRDLCGCEANGTVNIVGMPARLAWIINECGKRLIDDILCSTTTSKEENRDMKQSVSDFLDIIRRRWQYEVSTNAENSRKRKKMMKDKIMPDSEDVKTFGQNLIKLGQTYFEKLKETVNANDYEMLCKLIIGQIIALNARRPLEASKIPLEFFCKREKSNMANDEMLSILTEDELSTYHSLSVFHVPGKLEQDCSILLTKDMETSIELIVNCRPILLIPTTNTFLFARPGLDTPFDGSAVVRELRTYCQLKKPEFLTCTGLRHYCATMALLKGKDFTSHMSKFMSHTLDIHNKNYCYPVDVINRGKIGHFLLGLQQKKTNSNHSVLTENQEITSNLLENETPQILLSQTSSTEELKNDHDYLPLSDLENDEDKFEEVGLRQRKMHKKRVWNEEDKNIVVEQFLDYLRQKKNPGPTKCSVFLRESGKLPGRTGLQLNTLIDNINRGKTKLPVKFENLMENLA